MEGEFFNFFPTNPSLCEELERLFPHQAPLEYGDVWDEFKHNGYDTEYVPDEEAIPHNLPVTRPIVLQKKKTSSKKKLPNYCVFCKNNGEGPAVYRHHILKDICGKVVCPILRIYKCPICSESGDNAHTIKYCPQNPEVSTTKTLKIIRNAIGVPRLKWV